MDYTCFLHDYLHRNPILLKGYQDTDFSWSTERIQVVGHFISPYTKKFAIISDTNLKN